MRLYCGICLAMISFFAVAEEEGEPTVYVDVSKKAQEEATKYDGPKLLAGLSYSWVSFQASVTNGLKSTKKEVNNFMLTVGVDYSKKLKKKFLAGMCVIADVWKGQKKTGSWSDMNNDYNTFRGPTFNAFGERHAELTTANIIPEVSLRGGYLFKQLKSAAFVKAGIQRVEGTYRYRAGLHETSKVKALAWVPLIGIGGEKRINKKFGVRMELNFPLNRTVKKYNDLVEHQTKMGRRTVRLMGTLSVPGVDKMFK